MAYASSIKNQVDLVDLAARLGLERPRGNGNWRAPHRNDSQPSLSIYKKNGIQRWKDHGADVGGDCIDLVRYVMDNSYTEAKSWLDNEYNFNGFSSANTLTSTKKISKEEWITRKVTEPECKKSAIDYLVNERKITIDAAEEAVKNRTVGYSFYKAHGKEYGEYGYGGEAVAFICRDFITNEVLCTEYRYTDPVGNGDIKNKCMGNKGPALWVMNKHKLKQCGVVVLVEGPVDALSVESCGLKGYASVATMGAGNLHEKDWTVFKNKFVIIAFDNDAAGMKGERKIHEILLGLDIPCMLIDKTGHDWMRSLGGKISDVNQYLKQHGVESLKAAIKKIETCLLPGQPVFDNNAPDHYIPRIFLPKHHFSQYAKYKVAPDASYGMKCQNRDDTTVEETYPLCGFRIAALSKVMVQSDKATMTGKEDSQPSTVFVASVQTARHNNSLVRQVMKDDKVYNLAVWEKFGGIYKPVEFKRLLHLFEFMTGIGERHAVNFVGLAYRNGSINMIEGKDCYFNEPEKQCPYYNLSFLSGNRNDAATVINAYGRTFKKNAAVIPLVWALGAHLKVFFGFWPHMVLQAEKATGKSTLIKNMENTIGFTMLSGQSIQTEFRILTSLSYTSQPIGWEELSAQSQQVIDSAVGMLQEAYNYTSTRRGADMLPFLLCTPVLLAGEDVPVQSLLSKIVRSELSGKKGELLPDSLPAFPVREWLQFLVSQPFEKVKALYEQCRATCRKKASVDINTDGAGRMVDNYAAILVAWYLLCDFSGLQENHNSFTDDLFAEMSGHIRETDKEREPWVWIIEIILGEIDKGNYKFPFLFEKKGDDTVLFLRFSHAMQHLSQEMSLRAKYNAFPIKTDKVLHKQVRQSEIIPHDCYDRERKINGKRVPHLHGLSLNALDKYGLTVGIPEDNLIPEYTNNSNYKDRR